MKEQDKQVNLRISTKLLMTEGVHRATQPFQQNSTQQQFHHKENMGEKETERDNPEERSYSKS